MTKPSGPPPPPFDQRLARNLDLRAARAATPRIYLPVGDQLQAAAEHWLNAHGANLGDEMRRRWLREIEQLDAAVIEIGYGPGAPPPALITIDSTAELVLGELASLEQAHRNGRDADDQLVDDQADRNSERRISRSAQLGPKNAEAFGGASTAATERVRAARNS